MMSGTIVSAFAEWDDERQAFVVFLDRGDDEPRPLRQVHRCTSAYDHPDPVEARLAWDVMIHCMNDVADGDACDDCFRFERRPQAERVAKRCNQSLKDLAKGVPPLEGFAAQVACMSKGGSKKGRRVPGFNLDHVRDKIAGTQ